MTKSSYETKAGRDIRKVVVVYPFTYINPHLSLPPIAAEYMHAGVIAAGREAVLLDMRFETDVREQIESADLVCLHGYFEDCSIFGKWHIHVIPQIMEMIPDGTPVVAGGTSFTDPGTAFAAYPKLDVITRGNPEVPVMDLLREGRPDGVKNLYFRRDGEIKATERVIHPLPEDIYPRRALRNPRYEYHIMGIKADLVRAAVGCNYRCKFCYQYGKDFDGSFLKWQGRSARSLFNEIRELDAQIVGWIDDDMTTDMTMLDELSGLLLENGVRKLYAGTGRIDHVLKGSADTISKMERAGFVAIGFGVESLKDETLKLYGKGQTLESVEKAMRMMQKSNILLICNFILGSPGESEEDLMDMLWFSRRWNVDTIVTNRFRYLPDSPLGEAIIDPATGRARPGMERIQGDELARIKYRIKFAQRTPFRLWLSLLKLYRHKGFFMDPFYLVRCTLETLTKHTVIEKMRLFPTLLGEGKRVYTSSPLRHFSRFVATAITPVAKLVNGAFELIDRRAGLSTTVLPKLFLYLDRKVYKKQQAKAQLT